MDTSILPPSYSLAAPSPSYSPDPAEDEQRLIYQRASNHASSLTGIYVRKEDKVTVILENQKEGTQQPEYGRRSVISGTVLLHDPKTITEVKVQLKGSVEILTLSQGFVQKDLCDDSYVLWAKDSEAECPSSLSLSCAIPSTYQYGQDHCPLPPSYDVQLFSENIQYVKVAYFLSVFITKTRKGPTALLLGKNQQRLHILIKYRPRSRPPRPVPYDRSFLSTIKVFIYPMQVFLPSVGVYEMTEAIPYHLQLIGSSATLSRLCSLDKNNPPVALRLSRQLVLYINGKPVAVNFHLGEAKMCSPPPIQDGRHPEDNVAFNLEGEVKVDIENLTVPSLESGIIAIRDFISLELSKSTQVLFQPLKHIQVVKLVTDPWSDTPNPFG
ncbi:hypothetical protein Moror_16468 [Moniliophthora roreri MCA 2997]|uniref:Arrestin-like N-terminal domain-containing protein n=1 Tax=Moniliophthora roreri (strain MCA 2997) TaxID=1381753 RepID=V2XAW5_MONRO|nr:hypothetical protein Moror_16468 [Moniliophthora roreri MCA 2997]